MEDTYKIYQNELEELLSEEDASTLKFSVAELNEKKRDELISLCKAHGVRHYGSKATLIEALLTIESGVEVLEASSTLTTVTIDDKGEVISAKGERV